MNCTFLEVDLFLDCGTDTIGNKDTKEAIPASRKESAAYDWGTYGESPNRVGDKDM